MNTVISFWIWILVVAILWFSSLKNFEDRERFDRIDMKLDSLIESGCVK